MSYVIGTYRADFVANHTGVGKASIGNTEGGFELEIVPVHEVIQADAFGGSDLDGIYRGGNCFLQATFIEADLVPLSTLFKIANATAGQMGTLGTLVTNLPNSGYLQLTRLEGTASPVTLTALYAALVPNQPLRIPMNSRLRRIALRFQLFPYDIGGGVFHWFQNT